MKNLKIKTTIGTVFAICLLTSNLLVGQNCSIYVTDNGSPSPASGDEYEVFWEVVRFSGGIPVETYTCSPNTPPSTLPYNYSWPYVATINCSLPDYEDDVFRVHVDIKRKNSFGIEVAGGRGLSVLMNTYEILNTNYSVYVTLTNP